ncbi:hypothetical protein V6N11_084362 [Hibiscus sabdariffa]|uniref:Uncharacterized protein n=1 Tax=Hibiscus sabdariffa TaxID=183260 RepID=A0ABR2QSU0_9ROSI
MITPSAWAGALIFCFNRMTKGMSRTETTGPALADYLGWKSDLNRASCRVIGLCLRPNNCSACLYTVTLDGRAVTSCYPLSQGSLPYKSKLSCIFLAAETLSIPISRRS